MTERRVRARTLRILIKAEFRFIRRAHPRAEGRAGGESDWWYGEFVIEIKAIDSEFVATSRAEIINRMRHMSIAEQLFIISRPRVARMRRGDGKRRHTLHLC